MKRILVSAMIILAGMFVGIDRTDLAQTIVLVAIAVSLVWDDDWRRQ